MDGAEKQQPLCAAHGRKRCAARSLTTNHREEGIEQKEAGLRLSGCDFGTLHHLPRERSERLVENQPQSQPARTGLLRATTLR
jgi:hypothetical protein